MFLWRKLAYLTLKNVWREEVSKLVGRADRQHPPLQKDVLFHIIVTHMRTYTVGFEHGEHCVSLGKCYPTASAGEGSKERMKVLVKKKKVL